jgi:hypothetical protein
MSKQSESRQVLRGWTWLHTKHGPGLQHPDKPTSWAQFAYLSSAKRLLAVPKTQQQRRHGKKSDVEKERKDRPGAQVLAYKLSAKHEAPLEQVSA